jgi:hypothetical protein
MYTGSLAKYTPIKHKPYKHFYIPNSGCPSVVFLHEIDGIELEKNIDGFVPDISLLSNGVLHTAIEVVHTHKDSEDKNAYYHRNGINVIYIDVSTVDKYNSLLKTTNYFGSDVCSVAINRKCVYNLATTCDMLICNAEEAEEARQYNREVDRKIAQEQEHVRAQRERMDEYLRFLEKDAANRKQVEVLTNCFTHLHCVFSEAIHDHMQNRGLKQCPLCGGFFNFLYMVRYPHYKGMTCTPCNKAMYKAHQREA